MNEFKVNPIEPKLIDEAIFYRCFDSKVYLEYFSSSIGTEHCKKKGGRYNPPEQFPALYFGSTKTLCMLEVEQEHLRLGILSPSKSIHIIAAYELSQINVLDLTDEKVLQQMRLSKRDLIYPSEDWKEAKADDPETWTITQQIGFNYWKDKRFGGIIYPSYAADEYFKESVQEAQRNLVLFMNHLRPTQPRSGILKLIDKNNFLNTYEPFSLD